MIMDNLIEIKNMKYQYHKDKKLFEKFSLQLDCKRTTVITGNNGSGKTTLSKLIMGILKPLEGDIILFGDNSKKMTLSEIGKGIGYVFQYPERQLFTTSVIDELTFAQLLKGEKKEAVMEKAEEMIELFALEKARDVYPFFLSYGEKKRLAIASALMNNPKYLILDEPTASLDKDKIINLSMILNKLEEKNVGKLIITHDKNFIKEHGERVIHLDGGRIVKDEAN